MIGEATRRGLAIALGSVAIVLSAIMEYLTQLPPAWESETAGTYLRFAGTTGGTLLMAAAVLLTFPGLAATRQRLLAAITALVGWLFIEIGSMTFSLGYDQLHLNQNPSAFASSDEFFFLAGTILLAFSIAAFVVARSVRSWKRWIIAILSATVGLAILFLFAVAVRLILPILLLVVLAVVIIFWRGRRHVVAAEAATADASTA